MAQQRRDIGHDLGQGCLNEGIIVNVGGGSGESGANPFHAGIAIPSSTQGIVARRWLAEPEAPHDTQSIRRPLQLALAFGGQRGRALEPRQRAGDDLAAFAAGRREQADTNAASR